MGKKSRDKGRAFEQRIARELRATELCPGAKRGFQTRGGTAEEPDIKGCGHLAIECKAHQKVNHAKAYAQAVTGAKEGQIPIVVAKDDYHDPVVVMDLRHLPAVWYQEPTAPIDQPVLVTILWEDFKREVLPRMLGPMV